MSSGGARRFAWHSALLAILVVIVSGTSVLFTNPATATDRNLDVSNSRVHRIFVPVSQSVTIKLNRNFGDMVIADGKIADAQPITDRILYVIGKGLGTTSISLFSEEKQSLGVIEVEVGVDVRDMEKAIRQAVPGASVRIGTANGRLRLAGRVKDGVMLSKVLEIARQYGQKDLINSITVEESQQVNLEVRVLEVSRNAGRELGVTLQSGSRNVPTGNLAQGLGTGSGPTFGDLFAFTGFATGNAPFANLIAKVVAAGVDVDVIIKALEDKRLARRLAEPNLTTLSGEAASFLAGGEVPVPVGQSDGKVSIEFKEYGVKLKFTPVVLDNSKINLRLEPEVSEVDPTTTIRSEGIEIPAFVTRKVSTVVELRDGQGFAIAGLLQSNNRKLQSQIPWLGQVPVLGALFRSSSYIKNETDLVIIVTPRIVRPAAPGQTIRTPLDKKRPANDLEFFLLGKLEVSKDMIRRYQLGEGVEGPYGHMLDFSSKGKMTYVKK
jgi:pilus assembly protein CpaC